jgi:hypothetical protein
MSNCPYSSLPTTAYTNFMFKKEFRIISSSRPLFIQTVLLKCGFHLPAFQIPTVSYTWIFQVVDPSCWLRTVSIYALIMAVTNVIKKLYYTFPVYEITFPIILSSTTQKDNQSCFVASRQLTHFLSLLYYCIVFVSLSLYSIFQDFLSIRVFNCCLFFNNVFSTNLFYRLLWMLSMYLYYYWKSYYFLFPMHAPLFFNSCFYTCISLSPTLFLILYVNPPLFQVSGGAYIVLYVLLFKNSRQVFLIYFTAIFYLWELV